jgi:hypothetical protein
MGAQKKKLLKQARKAERRELAKVVEQDGHHKKEKKR